MYAIVLAGGKQYKVQEGATITVDLLKAEAGAEYVLDKVLMPLPVNLAPPQSSTRGDICVGARALERVGPARWQ